jgi:hypothetical protein
MRRGSRKTRPAAQSVADQARTRADADAVFKLTPG